MAKPETRDMWLNFEGRAPAAPTDLKPPDYVRALAWEVGRAAARGAQAPAGTMPPTLAATFRGDDRIAGRLSIAAAKGRIFPRVTGTVFRGGGARGRMMLDMTRVSVTSVAVTPQKKGPGVVTVVFTWTEAHWDMTMPPQKKGG